MSDLKFSKFNFSISFRENTVMPPENAGIIFRGALGIILRKMVCVYPEKKYCTECDFQQKCAYGVIVETSPPLKAVALSKNMNIPRPFVIQPPILTNPEIKAEQKVEFSIVFIGSAITYWPYIFQSIRALGEEGIGKRRTRFDLVSVSLENPASQETMKIYDLNSKTLKDVAFTFSSQDLVAANPYDKGKIISLNFVSPTVIKSCGQIVKKPEFSDIIRRLRDRLNVLGTFFGEGSLITNPIEIVDMAKEVISENVGIYWFNNSRYSTKSKIRHNVSGFMGLLNLFGNLAPFWEMLLVGQYINVGKQVSFGNGRYKILESLV